MHAPEAELLTEPSFRKPGKAISHCDHQPAGDFGDGVPDSIRT
jgi:hypothetical protein